MPVLYLAALFSTMAARIKKSRETIRNQPSSTVFAEISAIFL